MRWATTRDRVLAVVLAVVVAGAAGCGLAGRDGVPPDRAGDPGDGGHVGGDIGHGHDGGHGDGGGPERGRLDDPKPPRGGVQATVIRVIDGDTLAADVRGRAERVRLIGVDAPETAARTECHGHRARLALGRLAGRGTSVRLAYDRERRDRYGRRLRYAWTADGVFVNAALIRGGHARPMSVAPNDRYAALFRAAGRRAWIAGSGLWSRCERRRPTPDGW